MTTAQLIRRVQRKRLATGLSLRGLGADLGVAFSTLARIERGLGQPAAHTRLRLEAWLDPERPARPCDCARCRVAPRAGWQCPGCRRCYAPQIDHCPQCGRENPQDG